MALSGVFKKKENVSDPEEGSNKVAYLGRRSVRRCGRHSEACDVGVAGRGGVSDDAARAGRPVGLDLSQSDVAGCFRNGRDVHDDRERRDGRRERDEGRGSLVEGVA